MNLVREHINEKFIQDSDPIKDMGIGVITFENIKRGDVMVYSTHRVTKNLSTMYKGRTMLVLDVKKDKNILTIKFAGFSSFCSQLVYCRNKAIVGQDTEETFGLITQTETAPIEQWKNNIKIYQPKEILRKISEL